MLLVGLLDQLSLMTMFYLVFLFVCLVIHMQFPGKSGRKIVKGIWGIVVIVSGLILISRYIYQFVGAQDFFENLFPVSQCKYIYISISIFISLHLYLYLHINLYLYISISISISISLFPTYTLCYTFLHLHIHVCT